MKKCFLYLLLLCVFGCGGISLIETGTEGLYSPEFISKIDQAKGAYSAGKKEVALGQLELIKDESLLPSERAMKKNLIGVINFSSGNYEQAIYQFNLALTTSTLDRKLSAQIHLNLASSYFKLGDIDNTLSTLMLCDFKLLEGREFQNFHKLRFNVAKELNKTNVAIESLYWMLSANNDLVSLRSSSEFSEFTTLYFSLDQSERIRLLKDFTEEKNTFNGYVTYLEVEHLYSQGKRDDAKELAEWIEDNYEEIIDVKTLADSFLQRLKNYASITSNSIGVILPLSGDKKGFGERALAGIDHAVRRYNEIHANESEFKPIVILVRDSEGSNIVGKTRVRELIEGHNVSLIIGGLFSSEALSEYEESKFFGTLFISLSQIHTEKSFKNHLLIEVPGSVESQIAILFDEKYLTTFGRRAAIIYPDTDRGQAIVEEFWRKATDAGVFVVGAHSFNKDNTDQRDTVQKLLGLKFKRERKEELEILKELHELEGATSIRRIQTLKPEIDFDWVFIPSTPSEAVQIIPSFGYFDAFNVPLVGDPSWRSSTIIKESQNLGKLFFLDSNVPKDESEFTSSFESRYNMKPKLIEIVGYEAFEIGRAILAGSDYKSRSDMEMKLLGFKTISGITGDWELIDSVWIKRMNLMSLYRGKTNLVRLDEVKAE